MFGQELVKLTVMDMVFLVGTTIIGDLFRFSNILKFSVIIFEFTVCDHEHSFRSLFLRIMNYCWIWDLERGFPGTFIIKINEHKSIMKYSLIFEDAGCLKSSPLKFHNWLLSWSKQKISKKHQNNRSPKSTNFIFFMTSPDVSW